jgi:LytS/YehU family sensor histidine kinase
LVATLKRVETVSLTIVLSGGKRSKTLTFIAVMSALGNVLSFISLQLAPIAPNIPLGPVSVSLAFDLSHLATFVAALFGGPVIGGMTGLIGGLVSSFEFGFSKGNIAFTGVVAGFIMSRIDYKPKKWMFIATTIISYLPEAVFTAFIFIVVYPALFEMPIIIVNAITVQILVKAFIEMAVMGVILMGLYGNVAFASYSESFFPKEVKKT